jgi:hypothetical protein
VGGLLVVVMLTVSGCSSAPRLPECRGPWRQINAPLADAAAPTATVQRAAAGERP